MKTKEIQDMYLSVPTVFDHDSFFDSAISELSQMMKSPRFSFEDSFPPLNLYASTTDKYCQYEIALTGYKKEWLDISIEGTTLKISANVPEEKEDESKMYLKRRIKATSFTKSYKIPEGFDTEKAEVTYEDGLLSIYIPIMEEHKPMTKKLLIK